jgi:hypothetical protein
VSSKRRPPSRSHGAFPSLTCRCWRHVHVGDRNYGVAEIVIGGFVLALVTSLPNAVAAVYQAPRGRGAAALSTALKSNSINVTAGLCSRPRSSA